MIDYLNVKDDFLNFLEVKDCKQDMMNAEVALDMALDYYKNTRIKGCIIDQEHDMLLFQWGTYDWGMGSFFEFDITRQLVIEKDEEYVGIYQLHMTIKYNECDELSALDTGEFWCSNLTEIDEIRDEIKTSDVMETILLKSVLEVCIVYEQV